MDGRIPLGSYRILRCVSHSKCNSGDVEAAEGPGVLDSLGFCDVVQGGLFRVAEMLLQRNQRWSVKESRIGFVKGRFNTFYSWVKALLG